MFVPWVRLLAETVTNAGVPDAALVIKRGASTVVGSGKTLADQSTLANLYQIPEYRSRIIGLVIPGVIPVSRITQQILDRSSIPYLRTMTHTTAELHRIITEDVSVGGPRCRRGLFHSRSRYGHRVLGYPGLS